MPEGWWRDFKLEIRVYSSCAKTKRAPPFGSEAQLGIKTLFVWHTAALEHAQADVPKYSTNLVVILPLAQRTVARESC